MSLSLMTGLLRAGLVLAEDEIVQVVAQTPRNYLDRNEFARLWRSYSDSDVKAASPWSLVDDVKEDPKNPLLVCSGQPDGYLRTTEILEEYYLGVEWRYPKDPNGNSGILVHLGEKDQVWPESIQIQLHSPKVGSVFPTSGAETKSILNPPPDLQVKPLEWNRCQVQSVAGILRVTINERWVGDVIGCIPQRGHIALQSEGSEVHFRHLEIRPLYEGERRTILDSYPKQKRADKRRRRG